MRDAGREHRAQLSSDPLRTRDARRWLAKLLIAEGFAAEDAREVEVAFSEACANVHRHAYHGRRDGRIGLRIAVGADGAVVSLEHEGVAFEPAAYRPPDLTRPEEHGYGLYLIRSLVDEVRFERTASGGRVTLVKHRRRAECGSSSSHFGGGHGRT